MTKHPPWKSHHYSSKKHWKTFLSYTTGKMDFLKNLKKYHISSNYASLILFESNTYLVEMILLHRKANLAECNSFYQRHSSTREFCSEKITAAQWRSSVGEFCSEKSTAAQWHSSVRELCSEENHYSTVTFIGQRILFRRKPLQCSDIHRSDHSFLTKNQCSSVTFIDRSDDSFSKKNQCSAVTFISRRSIHPSDDSLSEENLWSAVRLIGRRSDDSFSEGNQCSAQWHSSSDETSKTHQIFLPEEYRGSNFLFWQATHTSIFIQARPSVEIHLK